MNNYHALISINNKKIVKERFLMKTKLLTVFVGTVFAAMALAGCTPSGGIPSEHVPSPDTKDLDIAHKVVSFNGGAASSDRFFASSGYGNGTPFNVTWNSNNVAVEENELHLKITDAKDGEYPYYGGEYRSKDFYGYGDYAVKMKPSKTLGSASTFFLYTGEWDSETLHPSTGVDDTKNPDNEAGVHDEIDIEFLGKDTTKVQFNYFTAGQGGNEFMYNLGFDASEEEHTYGFRFEEGRITWFIDEKPVYTATKNVPTHPGRILTNYWVGDENAYGWMGQYDSSKGADDVTYEWFSASSQGKETHKEEEPIDPPGGDEFDWDDVEPTLIGEVGGNTETYKVVVSDDQKSMDVTYTDVGQNWNNINVAVPSDKAEARRIAFEVENKGENDVAVRGNANASTTHGDHNISAVNVSAKQDGKTVNTDLEWGGSYFVIKPGEKSFCEITYSEAIATIEWMIDSHITGTQSGHVVISNLKYALAEEHKGDTVSLEFSGDGYECVTVNGVASIRYESIADNSYKNVNASLAGLVPAGSNTLSFDFENKGDESVQLNIDLRVGETSYVINRDDVQYDWYNESESRAQFNIAAHSSREIVIAFDSTANIQTILMFVNSSWAENPTTHTNGNMTISNVRFSTAN